MMFRTSSYAKRMVSLAAGALLAVSLGFVALSGGARADSLPPTPEIDKIRDVINAQIEAFKRDDAVLAFSFTAPGIKEIMGTPEQFLELVRAQYLPVYRSKKVEFRAPVELANQPGILQPALVTGPDGLPVFAVYTVERQTDGAWLISGCLLYKLIAGDGTAT